MQHDEVKRCLELAEYRLDIAREDLQVAIENMSANHLRAANNRAYYSIYHAITAVLALEQTAFKRHKDTLAYFNKKYIKDDIFPRTLVRQISRAEEVRHASDYDEFYIVAKEETQKQIECAQTLLQLVEMYISNFKESRLQE